MNHDLTYDAPVFNLTKKYSCCIHARKSIYGVMLLRIPYLPIIPLLAYSLVVTNSVCITVLPLVRRDKNSLGILQSYPVLSRNLELSRYK